jgi:hypothetical protein
MLLFLTFVVAIQANAVSQADLALYKTAYRFSAMATCGNGTFHCKPCQSEHGKALKDVKPYNIKDTKFFTAYSPSLKSIILAYGGTKTFRNILTNADFELASVDEPYIRKINRVHRGFYLAAKLSFKLALRDLKELQTKYKTKKVLFAGHSLGGAMAEIATLIAVKTRTVYPEHVSLVTLGAPKVGNSDYVSLMDGLGLKMHRRLARYYDIVPLVPELSLSNNVDEFRHAGLEIFETKDGEWVVCGRDKAFDPKCNGRLPSEQVVDEVLNLNSFRSIKAHISYFGVRSMCQ